MTTYSPTPVLGDPHEISSMRGSKGFSKPRKLPGPGKPPRRAIFYCYLMVGSGAALSSAEESFLLVDSGDYVWIWG